MASTCRKCGAPIIWLKTPAGRWMPADEGLVPYKQDPEGKNYVVTDYGELIRCKILEKEDMAPGQFLTGMARIPHWATCPNADEFRKGGKRDRGCQDG